MRESSKQIPGSHTPQCEEDGSYSLMQCHGSTGYCWCASKQGEKIPGTQVRFKQPNCTGGKTY